MNDEGVRFDYLLRRRAGTAALKHVIGDEFELTLANFHPETGEALAPTMLPVSRQHLQQMMTSYENALAALHEMIQDMNDLYVRELEAK